MQADSAGKSGTGACAECLAKAAPEIAEIGKSGLIGDDRYQVTAPKLFQPLGQKIAARCRVDRRKSPLQLLGRNAKVVCNPRNERCSTRRVPDLKATRHLNNMVEQDHRTIKKRNRPMHDFKSFVSASATLKGIGVANVIRKDQITPGLYPFAQFAALAAERTQRSSRPNPEVCE